MTMMWKTAKGTPAAALFLFVLAAAAFGLSAPAAAAAGLASPPADTRIPPPAGGCKAALTAEAAQAGGGTPTPATSSLAAGADGVILEMHDEYTLRPGGGVVHRHAVRSKILTPFAFNRLMGETFIFYNPAFQELEIFRSRTTMIDGTEVDSTKNAFNEVLPRFCNGAPPFSGLREMVVTHLGLEVGAVIDTDYEVRSAPGFWPFLMGEETFGGPDPIMKKTVVVHVPEGVGLFHELLGGSKGAGPSLERSGGYTTYVWQMSDLPLYPGEPMAEEIGDAVPRLAFSTCPSWDEAARLLAERFHRAASCSGDMRREIDRLRAGASSGPVALARAIRRFVAESAALAAVPFGLAGYAVRPAADTFRQAVGSGLDRAALLFALLEEAGLRAEPVLVSAHRKIAAGVPSWLQFDKAGVLVIPEHYAAAGGAAAPIVLDPSRSSGLSRPEEWAGRTLFRVAFSGDRLLALSSPCRRANRVRARADLVLDEAMRLGGTVRIEVAGDLNPWLDLSEGYEEWAGRRLARIVPGAEVGDVRVLALGPKQSAFEGRIVKPASLKKRGGLWEFMIPDCPGGAAGMYLPLAAGRRATTLRLPRGVTEDLDLSLTLPAGVAAAVLPEGADVVGLPGEMSARVAVKKGVLRVSRHIDVTGRVAPGDYPALRAILLEWTAPDGRRVMLGKRGARACRGSEGRGSRHTPGKSRSPGKGRTFLRTYGLFSRFMIRSPFSSSLLPRGLTPLRPPPGPGTPGSCSRGPARSAWS